VEADSGNGYAPGWGMLLMMMMKCYLGHYTIYTLLIFDRVRVRVRIRFNVQMKYSNSMIFKN